LFGDVFEPFFFSLCRPFFLGGKISYADIHWFPWIVRLPVIAKYRDFVVPQTPEYRTFALNLLFYAFHFSSEKKEKEKEKNITQLYLYFAPQNLSLFYALRFSISDRRKEVSKKKKIIKQYYIILFIYLQTSEYCIFPQAMTSTRLLFSI
jgi:hypothetical protein